MRSNWRFALILLVTLVGCAAQANVSAPTAPAATAVPATAAPAPTTAPTAAPPASAAAPQRPFPQHTVYTSGTIKPKGDQAKLDAAVLSAYRLWKQAYLKSGCGEGRFYVDPGKDIGVTSPRGISVSEGQGYGMLLTVFMAGADPDAQHVFDGLYAFFHDHPSAGSPDLMAWKQVEGCQNVDGTGTGSATDGDMDIAYALLLADKQWGSAGAVNYRQAALKVIGALRAKTVNPQTHTLLLGDWVTASDAKNYNGTRTSDFMIEHLRAYADASGDAEWTRVADTSYSLIATIQRQYSPATGLLPDFVQDIDTTARPADPHFLESDTDGQYAYNACRLPLRIATDYLLTGDKRALAALRPINDWLKTKTYGSAHSIYGGYKLDGTAAVNYYEPAFAAPFGVSAMVSADNQKWLNSIWSELNDNHSKSYYSDSLRMLSMLVMSGNWWSPRN